MYIFFQKHQIFVKMNMMQSLQLLITENNVTELERCLLSLKTDGSDLSELGTLRLEGSTLLEKAVELHHTQCIQVLLQHGLPSCGSVHNYESKFYPRLCPIHKAVLSWDKDAVLCLLRHNANPDCYHGLHTYRSPLYDTITNPVGTNVDMIKILIFSGAKLKFSSEPRFFHHIFDSPSFAELLPFFIGAGLRFPSEFKMLYLYIGSSRCCEVPYIENAVLNIMAYTGICCCLKPHKTMINSDRQDIAGNCLVLNNTTRGLNLQDWCRIVIRKTLIGNARDSPILQLIEKLHLPSLLQEFISFGILAEYRGFLDNM